MSGWLAPTRLVGLALPMAVWALHFVVAYSLVGMACERGWRQDGGLMAWLVALTLAALAGIVWQGLRAFNAWRDEAAGGTNPRARFMALATAMVAGLAAVSVLFTAIPMALLSPCA